MFVDDLEIVTSGRLLKTARLRHEWCDFANDPAAFAEKLRHARPDVDLFTFVTDLGEPTDRNGYHQEEETASILTISSHQEWFESLNFKVRNKIRKAQKAGVSVRIGPLDNEFAAGVEVIYNESPIRQGRRFWHYGKRAAEIKEDLGSFAEQSVYVGAYFESKLIGFAKLFRRGDVLRTVHIVALLSHRDKPVMDLLISKAVEICEQGGTKHFEYGSWATGGLGAFREKHGFKRLVLPRYYVPLSRYGALMLKLNLHKPLRSRIPKRWVDGAAALRRRWYARRHGAAG